MEILASFFGGSESNSDSDFDVNASICSNKTGGTSYFDKLSLAYGDDLDIYSQGNDPDSNKTDDSAGDSMCNDNSTLRDARNFDIASHSARDTRDRGTRARARSQRSTAVAATRIECCCRCCLC